jgi:2-succinyl-5-enolpyruvyl-6-hydroxy-3-cyclohexene-1-carboxylate synthase
MISTDKQHVFKMAHIAAEKGLRHVIISPGSRSAPLVIAFNRVEKIRCYAIADERSAAFVAMGMAQQLGEPVGLICTSGSAVLNYAPAIAEAFYQKIPLIVMTADRPNESIDQGENQSINQYDIYKNYIKKSFELPVDTQDTRDLWYSARIVNEAFNLSVSGDHGPVHINVPLREPLYQLKTYDAPPALKIIKPFEGSTILNDSALHELNVRWKNFTKKIILVGTLKPNENINALLEMLAKREDCVVFSENTSNQCSDHFINCIDPIIDYIQSHPDPSCHPELVITIGGGLISKKIKFAFRQINIIEHWHVSNEQEHWDNFHALSHIVPLSPENFLSHLVSIKSDTKYDFSKAYQKIQNDINDFKSTYLSSLPFCDFSVFHFIQRHLPAGAILFLGNSTPIRYSNLFDIPKEKNIQVYANRGVSGIDGVVSTSAGGAMAKPDQLHICIVGDISFFYDSNAWWNDYLGENFKCILLNNQGGNIFKIIPGPDALDELETFFETKHNMNALHVAKQFNINYFSANDPKSLSEQFSNFMQSKNGRPSIFEISTPGDSNTFLRAFVEKIKLL